MSLEPETPPAGEEIHLPGSSYVPLVNALGASIALLGLTLGTWMTVVGLLILLGSLARWIADTRRDVNELPLEH